MARQIHCMNIEQWVCELRVNLQFERVHCISDGVRNSTTQNISNCLGNMKWHILYRSCEAFHSFWVLFTVLWHCMLQLNDWNEFTNERDFNAQWHRKWNSGRSYFPGESTEFFQFDVPIFHKLQNSLFVRIFELLMATIFHFKNKNLDPSATIHFGV